MRKAGPFGPRRFPQQGQGQMQRIRVQLHGGICKGVEDAKYVIGPAELHHLPGQEPVFLLRQILFPQQDRFGRGGGNAADLY